MVVVGVGVVVVVIRIGSIEKRNTYYLLRTNYVSSIQFFGFSDNTNCIEGVPLNILLISYLGYLQFTCGRLRSIGEARECQNEVVFIMY